MRLAGLRLFVIRKPVAPSPERLSPKPDGAFLCARDHQGKRKESCMRWFAFLFSTRFWIAVWILVLFVGLLPLPPAAELVILVGFLSHTVWFVRGRLRRAAQRRALAKAEKAEEEEYRRLRRRRSPRVTHRRRRFVAN